MPDSTTPSSIGHRKRPKWETVGDRGFEGGYSCWGCQPTEPPDCGYGPPKATVSRARPLSPAMGPSQDFRPAATACKERHQMDTIQKNNQQRALHISNTPVEGVNFTSDIDETNLLTCLLIKKKKNLDKLLVIRNKLFFWGDGEVVK